MEIVVFGASGKTGTQIVKQTLKMKHRVIANVRTPDKLKIAHQNLEIIKGDVTNKERVTEVINRGDAVICVSGAASPFKFDNVIVDGMAHIINAMEQSKVKRLIYLSFIGVKESQPMAGFVIKYVATRLLRHEMKGHELREDQIKQSKLRWTIVRAATLTNGTLKKVYKNGNGFSSRSFFNTISRADVADYILKQIISDGNCKKATAIMY